MHAHTRYTYMCRDDLERAVRNMKGLGRGLEIITLGGPRGSKRMIQSVPCELSNDRECPFVSVHSGRTLDVA
jgi:hypothetical protein